jgi:hypothetical protein
MADDKQVTTDSRLAIDALKSLRVVLSIDSPETRGWSPAVQQSARRALDRAVSHINALQAERIELQAALKEAQQDAACSWIPAHERVPAPGTECVVLLCYSVDKGPFPSIDTWAVQREDPTGMGGPTIETGEGWNDNHESDVIAWFAVPPHPPADWDQRMPAPPGDGKEG